MNKQTIIKKALLWNAKYDSLNDLRDIADNEGNTKEYNKLDRQCADAFEKHLEYMAMLPKYEQKRIEKQISF